MRIVLLGAGSTVFTAELITDFLAAKAPESGEVRLVDIDPDRLDLARRFAEHLVKRSGKDWTVASTTIREDALASADVVINTIEVAGLANVDHDYEIPKRYGVDQCIGDTIGPGGLFKALRTVPTWLEILADIERLCPEALVLNYTNPMSIMVLAAERSTAVPVYGLCHSVHYTIETLAGYLNVEPSAIEFQCAGVNHLAWITSLRSNGTDLYPALFEAGRKPGIWEQDPVRFELMFHLGRFPTETSGHVSEYVPYFRSRSDNLGRYTRSGFRGESGFYANNWPRWRTENDQRLGRILAGEESYPMQRGGEAASYIIEAIATGQPAEVYVNTLNTTPSGRLIDNLPDGVVEVKADVDSSGVKPQPFGDLPPQLASWDRRHMEFHELVVTAILEHDREAAVHALMIDPLTSAVCAPAEIRRMFDEMAEAQRQHVPAFVVAGDGQRP